MLQKLHERIKGWVAGAIITLISITFVLWGIQYYIGNSHSEQRIIAKVNGEKITWQALNTLFQRVQRQQEAATKKPLTHNQSQQIKGMILQDMIMQALLLQSCQHYGFIAAPLQLEQLVASIPAFQVDGQFSVGRFQQLLAANGTTPNEFYTNLANRLVVNQLQDGIQSSEFILPSEVQHLYQFFYEKRNFSYLVIPAARFKNAKINNEIIKSYYETHQKEFQSPEKVSIEYIQLSPKQAIAHGDQLSDLTYTNPQSLLPAAKALNVSIQQTEFFTEKGAKMGVAADAKVVAAAFSGDVLTQGNNSNLITLKEGSVVVLRVKQHVAAKTLPQSKVEANIRQQLSLQWMQTQAALLAGNIQSDLQKGISPQSVASQNQLTWRSETSVTRRATLDKNLRAAVFNLSLSPEKSFTVITLAKGDSAIVHLTKIIPAPVSQMTAAEKKELSEFMLNYSEQLMYRLYVNGLQKSAKVKTYPQNF